MKLIPEKVFVTGATGLLGQMLLKKLQEKKCKLGVLLEPALKASCTFSSEIDVIVGDITQPESYRYYLKDCTCVIHIAALTQVYPRSNPLCFKINTEAVNGLAQEVLKNGIQRFIHIGSASSFGSGTKHRINNEGSEFNLKAYRMDYINSKYEAQNLLLKLYKEQQLPVIIINPTFMIGPYDRLPSSGKILKALLSGTLPGFTRGGRSFVYSGDVADAIINAMHLGRLGECYITGGHNISYQQFFKMACSLYQKPFRLIQIPLIFTKALGLMGSIWARITKKPPVLSFGVSLLAGKYQYYSSEKAQNELNYRITPLNTAIKESVDWMVENNVFTIK